MHGRYIKDYLLYVQFISPMMLEPRAVHISILWAKICNTDRRRARVCLLISPSVHQQFSKAPFFLLGFSDHNQAVSMVLYGYSCFAALTTHSNSKPSKDLLLQMSQGSHSTIYPTLPKRASHCCIKTSYY